jgi:AICAR transformylase/IMP cyclohydrolase PurH
MEAFFGQETIAPVTNKKVKTLECERYRGLSIPYRKIGGRVLYQKRDVIDWLESHELVTSTSEYKKEVKHG